MDRQPHTDVREKLSLSNVICSIYTEIRCVEYQSGQCSINHWDDEIRDCE
jgi:hypothetical protein